MDTHRLALVLMALQGCLGAFDTIYHHELTEALPSRSTARLELSIHAIRALIYSALFIGLSSWEWDGLWAPVLILVFAVEIVLTLWDFVIEDRTRLLPASERVTHTILAINGGAFVALLCLNCINWMQQSTTFAWQPQGTLGIFLALCGIGVGLSAVRDAIAALSICRRKTLVGKHDPVFGIGKRHFLITGGTGFIGTQLIKRLLVEGHDIDVLTRNVRKAAWQFDGQVVCFARMVDVPADRGINVIVNLAGARILGLPWTAKRRAGLLSSRTCITASVVSWIERASRKPELLISASAIGYYGIQPDESEAMLDESSPPQSIFMSELCQRWEAEASMAVGASTNLVIARFGMVLGRGGALPMMLLPIRLGIGGRLGSGRQWISWIHIDDLIQALGHVSEQSRISGASHRIYNFTTPTPVRQAEFARIAGKILKRPTIMPTPVMPLRVLLGEQSGLLVDGQCVMPVQLQAEHFKFTFPELPEALRDLC